MMAHRGLSASQPWMRADSHDGPELRLHLEAEYIDAALTFVSPPTSSCDARPDHTNGTIVCDLERRRIASLLPDREQASAQAWLADHPEITVVARDRGGGYG